MSNLHPDMNGNWADAPYVCEKCGRQFTDDSKLCGSFFSTEAILCSQECSVEHDYAIAEQLQSQLTAAQQRVAELEGENRTWNAGYQDLTADNARLQARVAELEQSRSIVHTQLSNIEWNL